MAGKSRKRNAAANNGAAVPNRAPKKKQANGKGSGGGPPTAYALASTQQLPVFRGGPRGSTWFTNTEYIEDVVIAAATATRAISINPSTPTTFPWLSRVAQGFELYRFTRLRITYTPTCATSTSGLMVGAFEYDANDAVPNNKQQLSSFEGSARGSIFTKVHFDLAPPTGWYYTNPAGVVSGDVRLTDVARFFYNTYGSNLAAGTVVGELTATYTIEFAKPETTIAYASGTVTPVSSTLSDMAGTSQTQEGDNVVRLESAGSSKYRLLVTQAGRFIFNHVFSATSTSAPTNNNVVGMVQLLRKGVTTTISPADYVSNISTTAAYTALNSYILSLDPSDVLTVTMSSALTAVQLIRVRYGFYKQD